MTTQAGPLFRLELAGLKLEPKSSESFRILRDLTKQAHPLRRDPFQAGARLELRKAFTVTKRVFR
jgi:hypothetical protein